MQVHSESFERGRPIPAEFAAGTPDGFGGNRNPHVAWSDAPAGTRSFVLLCIDTDAPTDALAEVPDARDAATTAAWIAAALRGEVPIPPPIAAQADHCLRVARALRDS